MRRSALAAMTARQSAWDSCCPYTLEIEIATGRRIGFFGSDAPIDFGLLRCSMDSLTCGNREPGRRMSAMGHYCARVEPRPNVLPDRL